MIPTLISVGKLINSNSVDKRSILENYDLVAICIDEICDDGYGPLVRGEIDS